MFKSNLIAGLIGITMLCTFLGIMIAYVKAIPLIAIMVFVVGLFLYDFVNSMREIRRDSED